MLKTWPRRISLVMSIAIMIVWIATYQAPALDAVNPEARSVVQQLDMLHQLHRMLPLERADPDQDGRGPARWGTAPLDAGHIQRPRVAPLFADDVERVDFAARDRANRLRLSSMLSAARADARTHPEDAANAQMLKSLEAIRSALGGIQAPDRYLTLLTSDVPPLAAVTIGNLDTASMVTFNVPGMGTDSDDMVLWADGAQNVWDEQEAAGAPYNHAVVAWIGYKTPPPGIDATLGGYAARGAPLLTKAIDDAWAARNDVHLTMNVVAHSYGTTTAADALYEHDLGIYAFVMLGSAGIENRIPDAAALNAQHVYAGEAADDSEARFGRTTRQDPRAPAFGAIPLSVNGDVGKGLRPVTGHDPVLHSLWNDNSSSSAWAKARNDYGFKGKYLAHFNVYGYLDAGTESIYNVGTATTPHATRALTVDR